MDKVFITDLTIKNVRHLKDIKIPLSGEKAKHLIFTGKNGSGKTSVLEAMADYLRLWITAERMAEISDEFRVPYDRNPKIEDENLSDNRIRFKIYAEHIKNLGTMEIHFNCPDDTLRECFKNGQFILAYYKDERSFQVDKPKHIEKVELKDNYMMSDTPRQEFIKYLADLKFTEALARNNGKYEKADVIKQWFEKFQELLRKIFDDPSLELIFDEEHFSFSIKEQNREIFDFNTLASGFAAVLEIVLDVMMRMEKNSGRSFNYDMPGIVLIDEVETHLHLELQKNILDILTTVFPNIQFIMSTHSPFILNSLQDAVIYDLEKHMIVENGLSNIPYSGIVEGYFKSNEMSDSLKEKFERYKTLTSKQDLSDDDFEEIAELEMFLNEIPDYLALGLTTEYQRIKMEFESREDI